MGWDLKIWVYASAHMANKYSILLNSMSVMSFINCHREIVDFNANKNVPKLVTTMATQISVLICFCGMKKVFSCVASCTCNRFLLLVIFDLIGLLHFARPIIFCTLSFSFCKWGEPFFPPPLYLCITNPVWSIVMVNLNCQLVW